MIALLSDPCRFLGLVAAAMAFAGVCARAEERARSECYSTAQTREEIARLRLVEPFALMQAASREMQGDPISARLCRFDQIYIYEISLLRRDGHIVRAVVDAITGKPHALAKQR